MAIRSSLLAVHPYSEIVDFDAHVRMYCRVHSVSRVFDEKQAVPAVFLLLVTRATMLPVVALSVSLAIRMLAAMSASRLWLLVLEIDAVNFAFLCLQWRLRIMSPRFSRREVSEFL